MRFYQTPLKNPTAASLSLLLGIVVIAAIALSLRVADSDRLSQKTEPTPTTEAVSTPSENPRSLTTQPLIQNDREQKETATATPPAKPAPAKPTPVVKTPTPTPVVTPAPKKSNRSTRTS